MSRIRGQGPASTKDRVARSLILRGSSSGWNEKSYSSIVLWCSSRESRRPWWKRRSSRPASPRKGQVEEVEVSHVALVRPPRVLDDGFRQVGQSYRAWSPWRGCGCRSARSRRFLRSSLTGEKAGPGQFVTDRQRPAADLDSDRRSPAEEGLQRSAPLAQGAIVTRPGQGIAGGGPASLAGGAGRPSAALRGHGRRVRRPVDAWQVTSRWWSR